MTASYIVQGQAEPSTSIGFHTVGCFMDQGRSISMKCQFKLVGRLPFFGGEFLLLLYFLSSHAPFFPVGLLKYHQYHHKKRTVRKRLGVLWNNTQIGTTTQSDDDFLLIVSFCSCHCYVYSATLDITIQW